jgi:tetratricopeptide (TPR) repeat protein
MSMTSALVVTLLAAAAGDPLPAPGSPALKKSLDGKSSHRYVVDLAKDQFASVRVEQDGIDVVVEVRDPKDELLLSYDAPTGTTGPEVAEWVSGGGGRFAIVVRPYVPDAPAGSYVLTVAAPRPASARDNDLMGARHELARGYERRTHFEYGPAREAAERALEMMKRAVGDDALATADAYELLGYVYDEIGLFDRGVTMFEAALAIRKKTPGVAEAIVNETENNLGWLEFGAGRYADAEKRFRGMAERRLLSGGPEAIRAENSHTGQANALRRLGRYAEAEKIQRAVIASAEKRMGKDAAGLAWMVRMLGLTLLDAGRFPEAEAVCSRTLAMPRNDQWGVLSRHTDLYCVAAAEAGQGRYAEAAPKFEEALGICAKLRGADSLCTAEVYEARAGASKRQGDAARARGDLEKAIAIRAAVLPAQHPEVAELRASLTSVGGPAAP